MTIPDLTERSTKNMVSKPKKPTSNNAWIRSEKEYFATYSASITTFWPIGSVRWWLRLMKAASAKAKESELPQIKVTDNQPSHKTSWP